MQFKIFLKESEKKDVEETLSRLPEKHQKLLKGYKFKFENGSTLKKDGEHVGVIFKDTIKIASPFYYSREHVLLHEIAHLIWAYGVSKEQKEEWNKLAKSTKDNKEKNHEESFCNAYASVYSKHTHETYNYPDWRKFILKLT